MNIVRKRKASRILTSNLKLGNVLSLVGYLRSPEINSKTDNPIYANNYSPKLSEAWLVVGLDSTGEMYDPEVTLMNLETNELKTITRTSMLLNPFIDLLRAEAESSDEYDKHYNKATIFLHEKIALMELEGAVREQSEVHGLWC